MINIFRVFLTVFSVTLVAAAVALFLYTERQHKTYNNTKTAAQTAFADWEQQNDCVETPQLCVEYSEQFKSWMAQVEQYIEAKELKPQFKYYVFVKNLDELYFSDLKRGGLASLGAASALLLLFVFSIVYLMGGKKKTKAPSIGINIKPELATSTIALPRGRAATSQPPIKKTPPKPEPAPPPKPTKAANPPDGNLLLNKATECADTEPMQAISYLEQALEGSLGTKLSLHALLLCGSLRLKNKIGEDRGKEQLEQIISSAPESEDAAKAKTVLETFK